MVFGFLNQEFCVNWNPVPGHFYPLTALTPWDSYMRPFDKK